MSIRATKGSPLLLFFLRVEFFLSYMRILARCLGCCLAQQRGAATPEWSLWDRCDEGAFVLGCGRAWSGDGEIPGTCSLLYRDCDGTGIEPPRALGRDGNLHGS
jgi:hypothetical protein